MWVYFDYRKNVLIEYLDELDKIYCNMGWNASSTHQTIEENNFNIYRSAIAIEFNIQHEHSNNYGLIETTNNQPYIAYYCYDNCQINTYRGSIGHHYDHHFLSFNDRFHKAFCLCGAQTLRPYNYSSGSSFISGGHTFAFCDDCGDFIDLGNSFIIVHGLLDENM